MDTETTQQGLYGKTGWTVESGVWSTIVKHLSVAEDYQAPQDASEVPDFVHFEGLKADLAQELLQKLTPENLQDCQNYGPTARSLLQACVDHPEEIELTGYYVGPSRLDERVSIEGFVDYGHQEYEICMPHDLNCQCQTLWNALSKDYKLEGYEDTPDELFRLKPSWNPCRFGWWVWWD